MSETVTATRRDPTGAVRALLADPLKLRMALSVAILLGWYFAAYAPLTTRIEAAKSLLDAERARQALRLEVEDLRGDLAEIEPRIPPSTDRNAWIRFLMEGIRAQPVRLNSLEPGPLTDVGPYKAATVTITVEGAYNDQARLLEWIETAPRLHRINSIAMGLSEKVGGKPKPGEALREPDLQMRIVLMGILGPNS